ncbi:MULTISPECIES: cupin domain-containing protein [Citricoccus]|uniref:cupin domain-containing protein n=1 Tax=Citricoccus TaxID=169133 RepID=UPI000255E18A|nr:cupin domain-containing protein [Citricoccus sp. CH26A]
MLERAGDHAFPYSLHDGPPLQMQWHFYGQSEMPVAVQSWELPPGGFEGMHSHGSSDMPLEEVYVVTAGTGHMTIDGKEYMVQAGDAVLAKVGTQHDLRNTGDVPLKLLVVWGQPKPSDYSDFGSAKMARLARDEPSSTREVRGAGTETNRSVDPR